MKSYSAAEALDRMLELETLLSVAEAERSLFATRAAHLAVVNARLRFALAVAWIVIVVRFWPW